MFHIICRLLVYVQTRNVKSRGEMSRLYEEALEQGSWKAPYLLDRYYQIPFLGYL